MQQWPAMPAVCAEALASRALPAPYSRASVKENNAGTIETIHYLWLKQASATDAVLATETACVIVGCFHDKVFTTPISYDIPRTGRCSIGTASSDNWSSITPRQHAVLLLIVPPATRHTRHVAQSHDMSQRPQTRSSRKLRAAADAEPRKQQRSGRHRLGTAHTSTFLLQMRLPGQGGECPIVRWTAGEAEEEARLDPSDLFERLPGLMEAARAAPGMVRWATCCSICEAQEHTHVQAEYRADNKTHDQKPNE
jgi:hypothetical protein